MPTKSFDFKRWKLTGIRGGTAKDLLYWTRQSCRIIMAAEVSNPRDVFVFIIWDLAAKSIERLGSSRDSGRNAAKFHAAKPELCSHWEECRMRIFLKGPPILKLGMGDVSKICYDHVTQITLWPDWYAFISPYIYTHTPIYKMLYQHPICMYSILLILVTPIRAQERLLSHSLDTFCPIRWCIIHATD